MSALIPKPMVRDSFSLTGEVFWAKLPKCRKLYKRAKIVSETSSGTQTTRKTLNFQMTAKKINLDEGVKKYF